ncbi:GNAT family N-acetyltransferase [Clostridium lundense]|uniref:GNAT family N-acetyltransferase n=1 Tax=Clostridium lundense TaxID=319475 RepID=UPI000487035A|nr:GNAT family N-acetyltransferase [Clostridium lundense]
MQNINLPKGYKIDHLSLQNNNMVKKLCRNCSDYYLLHGGVLPSEKDIEEIFTALPPNKNYEDKFVLGIYNFDELVGVVDIIKNFPTDGEWMLGLMLIDPTKRGNGLGKIVHASLVAWAINECAKSFRIGVIDDNYKGIKFWSSLGYAKIKEVNMDFSTKTHIVNVMRLQL